MINEDKIISLTGDSLVLPRPEPVEDMRKRLSSVVSNVLDMSDMFDGEDRTAEFYDIALLKDKVFDFETGERLMVSRYKMENSEQFKSIVHVSIGLWNHKLFWETHGLNTDMIRPGTADSVPEPEKEEFRLKFTELMVKSIGARFEELSGIHFDNNVVKVMPKGSSLSFFLKDPWEDS